MLDERVQALEERTGRIEVKLDAVTDRIDRVIQSQADTSAQIGVLTERMTTLADRLDGLATAQADMRADMKAMAGDLRAEMTAQSESFRADMKAMATDLKSVEISQANMRGQLTQMPSTWTMFIIFLSVSLALVTMILGGLTLVPVLQDWARQALS